MQKRFLFLTLLILFLATPEAALGQSTEFTFQGRLLDNSLPPTASYDFEFTLFDAATGGNELGLIAAPGVSVTSGVFSVPLDFGSSFDGGPRFLQIAVRPAGSPDPFIVLDPRQQISSTPYAIRSLNAAAAETAANALKLGGVDAAEYVQDDDERLTNERAPAPGSGHYIQNQSSGPQPSANFHISGTGKATILSAATQFNLGNSRILSSLGTLNTFVGINNGSANISGQRNTFVGSNTGVHNTTGDTNTFVGSGAGFENVDGSSNAFYGYNSGLRVTSGSRNSFLGTSAGGANLIGNDNAFFGFESGLLSTGNENSFFGSATGRSNTSGSKNVFLGRLAGLSNTTGTNNSFIGMIAGNGNVTGSNNVALGGGSGFVQPDLSFATAIGPGTIVASSNTIQLGRSSAEERVLIPGDLQVNGNIIGNLPTGSSGYIQNRSTTQSASNFNISNTGHASIFNARTEYRINGGRVVGMEGGSSVSLGSPNGSNPVHIPGRLGIGAHNPFNGLYVYFPDDGINWEGKMVLGKCPSGSGFFSAGLFMSNTSASGCDGPRIRLRPRNDLAIENRTGGTISLGTDPLGLSSIVIQDSFVRIRSASGGSNPMCTNTLGYVAGCASSLRYKTNVFDYSQSLNLINRLRPVSFNWKSDGKQDLGLIAEEVEKVDPLLVTYNQDGEVQGVKYDRIGVVLINVVKEQQEQIEAQQKQIDALKAIVCELKPGSAACK